MIKIILILLVIAFGLFVPVKTAQTGGGCPEFSLTERHNLILGDTLPKAGDTTLGGEGCAPLITHRLYLL